MRIIYMNSICCCQCGDDFEEFPTNTIYRHCLCLRFFFHQLLSGRIEGLPVSSPIQGTASSSGVGFALPKTSLNDENHSAARPLPYDAEHRFTLLQRGLVSRREKSMTHFQDASQALRSTGSSGMEFLDFAKKRSGIDSTEDSKSGRPESLEKSLTVKAPVGLLYEHCSDHENVCLTCLDEYTSENPKIVT